MKVELNAGERVMALSPEITLSNGLQCTPQHFLEFEQTIESVSKTVLQCSYAANFPIFAYEEHNMLFIQIGIIGRDNYRVSTPTPKTKIVYGRRWLIERFSPTSEIVQTIMLAIQKAKEHELRELIKVKHNSVTTPFNCHLDIPMLAELLKHKQMQVKTALSHKAFRSRCEHLMNILTLDGHSFILQSILFNEGTTLITIELPYSAYLKGMLKTPTIFTLEITTLTEEALLYRLVEKLINMSNKEVVDNFTYKNQAVFNENISLEARANMLYESRNAQHLNQKSFNEVFTQSNYQTDQSRVPRCAQPALTNKLKHQLALFDINEGIYPSWLLG